jgi:uncharacterized membrane protein
MQPYLKIFCSILRVMNMAIEKPGERLSVIPILQLACLVMVAFGFWLAISAYPSLPHTYPVHFTLSGVPDGWDTKSWTGVLRPPLIQLVFFILMAGMTSWSMFSFDKSPGLYQPYPGSINPSYLYSQTKGKKR